MRTRVLRIGITANVVNILQKRDRDIVRMLLIEMAIYIYTTLPNTLVPIYRATTQTTYRRNLSFT
jgi:hypothetical protein